jgi:hypothetical protein
MEETENEEARQLWWRGMHAPGAIHSCTILSHSRRHMHARSMIFIG